MHPDEVKRLIEANLPDARVEVAGDGSHFEVVVISAAFAGQPTLQRHRMVKGGAVGERIADGSLHAFSIRRTLTPEEAAEES